MLYQFFINSVPSNDDVCQWIFSKCTVESKTKSEKYGKKCYIHIFRSSKKEWAIGVRCLLLARGAVVSEIVEYEVKTY